MPRDFENIYLHTKKAVCPTWLDDWYQKSRKFENLDEFREYQHREYCENCKHRLFRAVYVKHASCADLDFERVE